MEMSEQAYQDYLELLMRWMTRKPFGPHMPKAWEMFSAEFPHEADALEGWLARLRAKRAGLPT
jgi:hypothetical protein